VTVEQVLASIKTYILPAFVPSTSVAFIASGTSKANDISTSLSGYGYDVEVKTLDGVDDEDESGSEEGEDENWEQVSEPEAKL
jgi:hypothetical protein